MRRGKTNSRWLGACVSLVLVLGAAAPLSAATPTCGGLPATIVGTDKSERIDGTSGDDVIVGRRGRDRIFGLGGSDVICGGRGSDRLIGGDGNDRLYGQEDGDEFRGGDGNDIMHGGPLEVAGSNGDLMFGEPGDDHYEASDQDEPSQPYNLVHLSYENSPQPVVVDLATGVVAGMGTDTVVGIRQVTGSPLDDTLTGGGSRDVLNGGGGNDTIKGGTGGDRLNGGDGVDDIDGEVGADRIQGGADGDQLEGGLDSDLLLGEGGEDGLAGGPGNDRLDGGPQNDTVDGGDDRDLADFSRMNDPVTVDLEANRAEAPDGIDVLTSIEDALGGDGNDVLKGDGLDNHLTGADGYDEVVGRGGADDLAGNEISGGTGPDRMRDEVLGAAREPGNDIRGGDEDDVLLVRSKSSDTFDGGSGTDRIEFGLESVKVDLRKGLIRGSGPDEVSGFEDVVGSKNGDLIIGNSSANTLQGGEGNDELRGGAGVDSLDGGASIDLCLTGEGLQRCELNETPPPPPTPLSPARACASKRAIRGTANNNRLVGTSGNDIICGLGGDDTIIGKGGSDTLVGNDGNDTLKGRSGNDHLHGEAGADLLKGGAGDDTQHGRDGRDDLRGGNGFDLCFGGDANDRTAGCDLCGAESARANALVFDRTATLNRHEGVYVLTPGKAERKVTGIARPSSEGEHAYDPAWAPNGQRIVFSARPRPKDARGESSLFTIRRDGTNLDKVGPNNGYEARFTPDWSPDGNRIAFEEETKYEEYHIAEIRPDGSDEQWIGNREGRFHPSYSPDGRRIAFEEYQGGVVRTKGTGEADIFERATSGRPNWHPLSDWIVFDAKFGTKFGNAPGDIYISHWSGFGMKRLTRTDRAERNPVVSPDGARIAYEAKSRGDWDIYVMNIDGSNKRRLTTMSGIDEDPQWSTNGNRIAFVGTHNGGNTDIYSVRASGGPVRRLTHSPGADRHPEWRPQPC